MREIINFRSSLVILTLLFASQITSVAQTAETTAVKDTTKHQNIQLVDDEPVETGFNNYEDFKPMNLPVYEERVKKSSGEQLFYRYNIDTRKVERFRENEISVPSRNNFSEGNYHSPIADSKIEENQNEERRAKFSPLQQVTDPEDFPYKMNVKVFMTFSNGANLVCSGSLIDFEWVLTAGHCVYSEDKNRGGWATSVEVVPAYEDGDKPFGGAMAKNLFSISGWTDNDDLSYDIGWIELERPVGFLTGWFGYGFDNDNDFFKNNTFYNQGYPAESPYDGNFMFEWDGKFDFRTFASEKNTVCQDRVGYGGQSGSGAYAFKSGDRIMYATTSHTKEDKDENRKPPTCYTRVTQPRYNTWNGFKNNSTPQNLDLVAMETDLLVTDKAEGQEISGLSFKVFNRSTQQMNGNWDVDIYLSDNNNISTSDELLSSQTFSFNFQPSEGLTVNTQPFKLPDGVTGKNYLGVVIDYEDSNTDNNDTDGEDALEINITETSVLTFEAVDKNNDPIGVDLSIFPDDVLDEGFGTTTVERRFAPGTDVSVYAPEYFGTDSFERWILPNASSYSSRYLDLNPDQNDKVYKAVYETPDIPVMPRQISKRVMEGTEAEYKVQIINKNNSTLNWNVSSAESWIDFNFTSGSLAPGATGEVTVYLGSENTTPSQLTGKLEFTSPDAGVSALDVTVSLRVFDSNIPPTPEEAFRAIYGVPFDKFGSVIGGDPDEKFISVGIPDRNEQLGVGYIYEFTEAGWGQGTEISPTEPISGERFGYSMDVLRLNENDFAAAGSPGTDPDKLKTQNTVPGSVYYFEKVSGEWQQQAKIQADVETGAGYGESVLLEQNPLSDSKKPLIIAGAPEWDATGQTNAGGVFVSEHDGTRWKTAPITPNESVARDYFGAAIDIAFSDSRGFMAIGAPGTDSEVSSGKVFVYEYKSGQWVFHSMINEGLLIFADFGTSIGISADAEGGFEIVVGAPGTTLAKSEPSGAVFSYSLKEDEWVGKEVPVSSKTVPVGGRFGEQISLIKVAEETFLSVSAPKAGSGKVFSYKKTPKDDEWQALGVIGADNKETTELFGSSLISYINDGKPEILVGVPGLDTEEGQDVGAVKSFSIKRDSELPQLQLSSAKLELDAYKGESKDKKVMLTNSGGETLLWELEESEEAPWITFDKSTGSIQGGASEELELTFQTEQLSPGEYNTSLRINSNDVNDESFTIETILSVTERDSTELMAGEVVSSSGDTLEAGALVNNSFQAEVSNNGKQAVANGFLVGFYLSDDEQITTEDSLFAKVRVNQLSEDSSIAIQSPMGSRLPQGMSAGTYYAGVYVDYSKEVFELDEANNIGTMQIELIPQRKRSLSIEKTKYQVTISEETTVTEQVVLVNDREAEIDFTVPEFTEDAALKSNTVADYADSTGAIIKTVNPASGTIGAGDTVAINVELDASHLSASGIDSLSIISNDSEQPKAELVFEVMISTAGEKDRELPETFSLKQNYPNPFNPNTNITYSLPTQSYVDLTVYNILGRKVHTLVNEQKRAGTFTVNFDASGLSSGVYIYKLQAGSYTKVKKMLLIK
ncbi:BACON domain-containing protein [Gracilimonas sp.]|uniref:BACON domain-containing protein n=1 Tax=Gracilimonas sp. TaxID=1974203 RepID=UPI003D0F3F45